MPVTGMYVVKRDNLKEQVMFDEITIRMQSLCQGLNKQCVDPALITQKVIQGLYQGITTQELDRIAAEIAMTMSDVHSDYGVLAARLVVSNLHKETKESFSGVMKDLYTAETEKKVRRIASSTFEMISKNAKVLDAAIQHDKDYNFDYFGFKILENSYLLRLDGKVVERPQHMLMRIAVAINGDNIEEAIETYNLMADNLFFHGSRIVFQEGTSTHQLASPYLLSMNDDSIEGIYTSLKDCGLISQSSGDIGINVHCIRATGSYIAGTNGVSNGLVPMLRVYDTLKNIDYDGTKNIGSLAIYLEPWHSDIYEFLELKKHSGKDELRAKNLNYALWVPDLFMKRVENNEDWCLICPQQCPELINTWGEKFESLYLWCEKEGHYRKKVKAQDLLYTIIRSQVDTGMPYIVYKDTCNKKTNHQHLGTIKSSSFNADIIAHSDSAEIATCNMASLVVSAFVADEKFDFVKLKLAASVLTRNLNRMIGTGSLSLTKDGLTRFTDQKHRMIGIGVQGLAETFIRMRFPYESEKARTLNERIYETIYYGALEASCDLAKQHGPHESYTDSPVSKSILQFDMWNVTPSDMWDWKCLKEKISKYGVRNSLLLAQMPASCASQIFGTSDATESWDSFVTSRQMASGEIQMIHPQLLKDLQERGLWNDDIKSCIMANHGSIQGIDIIPSDIQELYKTVWEISQKNILTMAADRGAFIDNSQSLIIHMKDPSYNKLSSMHFFGWKLGLKTGMFVLKTISTDKSKTKEKKEEKATKS